MQLKTVPPDKSKLYDEMTRQHIGKHLTHLVNPKDRMHTVYFDLLSPPDVRMLVFPLKPLHPFMDTLDKQTLVEFKAYGALSYFHWTGLNGPHHAVIMSHQETIMPAEIISNEEGGLMLKYHTNGTPLVIGVAMLDMFLCAMCCAKGSRKKCSKCIEQDLTIRYCTADCQKKHWPAHKKFCGGGDVWKNGV